MCVLEIDQVGTLPIDEKLLVNLVNDRILLHKILNGLFVKKNMFYFHQTFHDRRIWSVTLRLTFKKTTKMAVWISFGWWHRHVFHLISTLSTKIFFGCVLLPSAHLISKSKTRVEIITNNQGNTLIIFLNQNQYFLIFGCDRLSTILPSSLTVW